MLFEMSKSSFDVVFWHDLIIGAWFEILINFVIQGMFTGFKARI